MDVGTSLLGITERERRFALAFFELSLESGHDIGIASQAYRRAFPMSNDSGRMAHQLASSERVKALVTVLRAEASDRAAAPASRLVDELERIAYSNVLDYGYVDEQGQFVLDLSSIGAREASAIAEVETKERVTDSGVHRTTKIRFHGKLDALDKLGRMHGLWADKMKEMSVEDLDRVIAVMERRLGNQTKMVEHA
jgi:Terminase small subunit